MTKEAKAAQELAEAGRRLLRERPDWAKDPYIQSIQARAELRAQQLAKA